MMGVLIALAIAHPPIPPYTARALEDLSFAIYHHAEASHQKMKPGEAYALAREFDAVGRLADISPAFMAGVAWTESRWHGETKGDGGASVGLWQMVAAAARSVFPHLTKRAARAALFDRVGRIAIAGLYWRRLVRRYGRKRAAIVFNCGPIRCGSMRQTRATRGYFRNYKKIKKRVENGQ